MPKNGLLDRSRASVVQERRVRQHGLRETEPPEWGSAPLRARSQKVRSPVGEIEAHVVEEKVRVGVNRLTFECAHLVLPRRERLRVARRATHAPKKGFTASNLGF